MRYIIEGAPRTKKNHMQIRGSGAVAAQAATSGADKHGCQY